ncbi:MAG TPA: hypothetical protein VNQ52_03660 [Microbacteriaceae bacterium]|nr:hypothetical protein [Microbacteriaceae bacterium]
MTGPRRAAASGHRWRWWAIGIAAFLAVDVALVWWALAVTSRSAAETAEPLPLSAFAPAPTPKPATARAVSTPTPTPTPEPLVLESMARQLQPIDGARAWRTASTACAGPSTIEWTEDGGASWTAWSAGDDVAGILGIVSYDDASVVGIVAMLGGDCRAEYRMSYTAGEFWGAYPDEQPQFALIDPASRAAVLTAAGPVASPCGEISELAEGAGGIAVLCTTTELVVGPEELSSAAPVSLAGQAVAVTQTGDGYLVAARRDPGCADGLQLSRVGADAAVAPVVCLSGHTDETAPVTLAAATDGTLWLWAGDRVGVSGDGGASWTGLG